MRKKNPEQKKLNFWVTIAKGLAPNEQKCIHASSAENIIEIDESQIQWTAIRYIYFVLLLRASSIIVKIEHAKALRPVATLFISIIFRRLRCRQGPLQHKGPENQIFRKSARNSWRASIYKMIQIGDSIGNKRSYETRCYQLNWMKKVQGAQQSALSICNECAKCYQRSAVYEDNLEGLMGQYLSNCASSPPLTQKMDNKFMLSMLKLMLVRGGVGV